MYVEKFRHFVHPGEYLDAPRVAHGIGMTRTTMAAANKPDHRHASRLPRSDTAQVVLDQETPLWLNTVLSGSEEK